MSEDEMLENYRKKLACLIVGSKSRIIELTELAKTHKSSAEEIVKVIEAHINKASRKLPALLLADSIIKNVQNSDYQRLFSEIIVFLFLRTYKKGDQEARREMFELRKSWDKHFPNKILYAIDFATNNINPLWPITATQEDLSTPNLKVQHNEAINEIARECASSTTLETSITSSSSDAAQLLVVCPKSYLDEFTNEPTKAKLDERIKDDKRVSENDASSSRHVLHSDGSSSRVQGMEPEHDDKDLSANGKTKRIQSSCNKIENSDFSDNKLPKQMAGKIRNNEKELVQTFNNLAVHKKPEKMQSKGRSNSLDFTVDRKSKAISEDKGNYKLDASINKSTIINKNIRLSDNSYSHDNKKSREIPRKECRSGNSETNLKLINKNELVYRKSGKNTSTSNSEVCDVAVNPKGKTQLSKMLSGENRVAGGKTISEKNTETLSLSVDNRSRAGKMPKEIKDDSVGLTNDIAKSRQASANESKRESLKRKLENTKTQTSAGNSSGELPNKLQCGNSPPTDTNISKSKFSSMQKDQTQQPEIGSTKQNESCRSVVEKESKCEIKQTELERTKKISPSKEMPNNLRNINPPNLDKNITKVNITTKSKRHQ